MARRRAAEIEGLRRSATMAPLGANVIQELLTEYQDALSRLEHIADVLRRLGPSWQASRDALNELTRLLHD